MKTKLFIISFLAITVLCFSCSKSNTPAAPANPIVGLWTGTYSLNQSPGTNYYYSLDLRADSSVLMQGLGADGNTYYANGTWSLTTTSFTATITTENLGQAGSIQALTGVYSSSAGTLIGTLGTPGNPPTTSFSLKRVN